MTGRRSRPDGRSGRRRPAGERAVSDVLGFALVFGIVVISITLLYTVGVAALSNIQHAEAMNNAERGFDVLADNMQDVHRDGAPSRGTELKFASGQLALSGQVSMNVSVTDPSGTGVSETFVTTPISYSSRETSFHYVSGAVVRTDRNDSAVVNDPPFRFRDERSVVSFVSVVRSGDTTSIGGGTVHLTARNRGSTVLEVIDESEFAGTNEITFNVSVTSPRTEAWNQSLRRQGLTFEELDAQNDTVVYSHETDVLYLRRTGIAVRLSE